MSDARIEDWDDAYANGAYIPGAEAYPPRWEEEAAAFRAGLGPRARLDLPYGRGERNRFDLFLPEGEPRGLVIFIHGGYWRAFDKSSWSWMAAGPLARGWAVAMPSYSLAPMATIPRITREIAGAIVVAGAEVRGPLRLAGHSAGGHLAARMVTTSAPLTDEFRARIERVVSISGLHDLRPLRQTDMNRELHLSPRDAMLESPALLTPVEGTDLICWVGADERPEFRRQSALLANIWRGLGAVTRAEEAPRRHHFDVIEDMADPSSHLIEALLGAR